MTLLVWCMLGVAWGFPYKQICPYYVQRGNRARVGRTLDCILVTAVMWLSSYAPQSDPDLFQRALAFSLECFPFEYGIFSGLVMIHSLPVCMAGSGVSPLHEPGWRPRCKSFLPSLLFFVPIDRIQDLLILVIYFFYFLAVLGIEPRASPILGKCSITELHPLHPLVI